MRLPYQLAAPALCLFVLPLCGPVGQAADETPKGKPLDVEVATSGPVHEAFAAPRQTSLDAPALVEKAPPTKPLNEEIPNEKPEGDNVQWIPGYWDYDGEASKYVWVSGIWRLPPPERQWAAGYWAEADGQWRRQPGFWAAFNDSSKAQEVVYYPKPPEPNGENLDEAPANKVFAPGSWAYGKSGYTWNAGQYITASPGWSWTASSYSWTPAGYTYTRGYWDYSYARRGLVYAPVYMPRTVRNVGNYYYRPTRVISPAYLANVLTRAARSRRFYLNNTRVIDSKKVTTFKLAPLTPAQRNDYRSFTRSLNQAALVRKGLEAKGTASLATGPIRHTINLPRPKALARADSRFQPPPRPAAAAAVRKAPPPKTTAAPAAAAKKEPAKRPAAPAAQPKKEPAKKAAPAPHPKKEPAKKEPPKKNNAKKTDDKKEHKK